MPRLTARLSGMATDAPGLDRFRATLDEVYREGHVVGRGGRRFAAFPTGMTRGAGEFLAELARGAATGTPAATLETGWAYGLSTLWIALGIGMGADSNSAAAARHITIDPFQTSGFDDAARVLMERAGIAERITHYAEDSALALPSLLRGSARLDFAFVDGGHLFENAFIDIFYLLQLVRPGGLIVIDDLWMPAIRTALRYFGTNCGIDIRYHAESDAARRFASLRVPERPARRAWDHFVAFGEDSRGT